MLYEIYIYIHLREKQKHILISEGKWLTNIAHYESNMFTEEQILNVLTDLNIISTTGN